MRKRTLRIALPLSLVTVVALASPAMAGPDETRVKIVPVDTGRPEPLPDATAKALYDAAKLAEENPHDLGHPWVDPASGEVVIPTVTEKGKGLAARKGGVTVTQVTRSAAALEKIKDAAIDETGDIRKTRVDAKDNRVVVTVTQSSDGLLRGLARRFGAESVVVEVDPAFDPRKDTRWDEGPNFFGGGGATQVYANEGQWRCTTGIPVWMPGEKTGMLTAGHCAPTGGYFFNGQGSPNGEYLGFVSSGSRENWANGVGTRLLSGQSRYRGDLALIEMPYASHSYYLWRGSASTGYSAVISQVWPWRPYSASGAVTTAAAGDTCTGGSTTGELCGWFFKDDNVNIRYSDGALLRNAHVLGKDGQCTAGGDSGGPVYWLKDDGTVGVRGIHSGGNNSGGWGNCEEYHTSVWDGIDGWGVFPTVIP